MAVTLRFLFDECLTADLVGVANSYGHYASHVKYLARLGHSDRALAVFVTDGDFVFVTNNGSDFRRIYMRLGLLPGLIVLLPSVPAMQQEELFAAALEALETTADSVNKLIEVDADCNVTIVDWPPERSNITTD